MYWPAYGRFSQPDYARREHAAPQRDSAIYNDRTELALAETLSGGDVIGRASNQLHELIEQIVVTWDEDARAHHLDLTGILFCSCLLATTKKPPDFRRRLVG